MWACPKLGSLSAQGVLFAGGVNTASPQAAVAEAPVEFGRPGSHSTVIAVDHKVGHTLDSQISVHVLTINALLPFRVVKEHSE